MKYFFLLFLLNVSFNSYPQDISDQILEELDDLEKLKDEIDESDFIDEESTLEADGAKTKENDEGEEVLNAVDKEYEDEEEVKKASQDPTIPIDIDEELESDKIYFDMGKEEKELLEMSKLVSEKISDQEWDNIAQTVESTTYEVLEGDWLFKISKKLFGTGFYYPKIWSLNPYIKNPHQIEPGMVLVLTTGSATAPPELKMGSFDDDSLDDKEILTQKGFDKFGDEINPDWLEEKKKLQEEGTYVNYTSDEDAAQLLSASKDALNDEYKKYTPNDVGINSIIPTNEYDRTGFDKNAKVEYNFKEGFSLNTFISSNFVQDYGFIDSAVHEGLYLTNRHKVFLDFEGDIDVQPGDKFSIYTPEGKVVHKNSDRYGYRYSVMGSVKILQQIEDKWQGELFDVMGVIKRGSRVTVYTPKIDKIIKTFNPQVIEAAIIQTYKKGEYPTFGDVVYLDRGRADGVEMGNVFEVYGFKDRNTHKNIVNIPAYKNGELTVITLSDNFATALVTLAIRELALGDIAITKSSEQALLSRGEKRADRMNNDSISKLEENVKIDLNVDDIGNDLYEKAKEIKLSPEEMAELERQEREKSILEGVDKDLRTLETLEGELEKAEKILAESKLDEDSQLESKNLENVETNAKFKEENKLEQIEEKYGKKYLDEQLVVKDNPYGLTEFDIEEVDELLTKEVKPVPNTKKSEEKEEDGDVSSFQQQKVRSRSSSIKKKK
jgi:hypothetical protein